MMRPDWIFDDSPIFDPFGHGQAAVDAIKALRHPKSALPGKAFDLPLFQERIIRAIYGPCDEHGQRLVRNVLVMVPRGNRKTAFGASLALNHLVGTARVPGGQCIMAAGDRRQARIAYEECRDILRAMKAKTVDIVDSRNRIVHRSGAFLEAVSSEAGTKHGQTPTFVLADELHIWPNRDLWDVMKTGLVKVPGSLMVCISTAGRGQNNVAHDVYDYARRVQRGEIDDPATLPIIFESGPDDDWRDERTWFAMNPGLSHVRPFPDLTGLRQLAREAESRPAEQEAFKQLHLNQWLDGAANPWLDMRVFDEGETAIDLQEREGERAWIGVDLGSTNDLTCVSLAFRDPDGGFTVKPFTFAPDASVRRRQERGEAPYALWRDQGHLITTEGDVTDYDEVEAFIRDLCRRFNVVEIALDPWGARPMMNRLTADNLPAVEHRQGFVSFSGPMKAFERAVLARKLRHDCPILRWCVSNVVVDTDPAGNIKANKGKAREKIDVAVASIMAIGRAEANTSNLSIYADIVKRPQGIRFI